MTRPHTPTRSFAPQRGASLIELMVGMTVGMFVVLAAVGAMMTTRQGSSSVADSYRLQQAGMMAMRMLGVNIRQAGAPELSQPLGQNTGVSFELATLSARGPANDQMVSGTDGGGANPDTLTVSYQHRLVGGADANVTRDCLGNSPGDVPARIDNTFGLSPNAPRLELQCTGSVNPGAPQALVGDDTRPTAEVAVEDFQVWYWVEPTPGIAGTQQRVTASDVVALGGWNRVRSVEVCLQLRGTRADYPVGGQFTNCQGAQVNLDGRLHQTFIGTFLVRNAF